MSEYLGAVEVDDGYNGARIVLHLVMMEDGVVLAVAPWGYFTWTRRDWMDAPWCDSRAALAGAAA